jgi:hypothetical protein
MINFLWGFLRKKKPFNSNYRGWLGDCSGDFGEDQEEAERGITKTGEDIWQRGKMTPEELAQYQRSMGTGQTLQDLYSYYLGLGPTPAGMLTPEAQYQREVGPLGQTIYQRAVSDIGASPIDLYLASIGELGQPIYERALRGVSRTPTEQYLYETGDIGKTLYGQILAEAQDPYGLYESTLQPQLQLAEDYINRRAQERGLLRSGIPIEQMGRAGAELAIREAAGRMNARANALQRAVNLGTDIRTSGIEALQTASNLANFIAAERQAALERAAGLTQYTQGLQGNRLANLANLYSQQQQYGLQAMNRQAGQAQAAGQYAAYPYQAQLGDIYGRKAAMYALPGQAIQTAGLLGLAALTGRRGKAGTRNIVDSGTGSVAGLENLLSNPWYSGVYI